jgi:hypothetical protein
VLYISCLIISPSTNPDGGSSNVVLLRPCGAPSISIQCVHDSTTPYQMSEIHGSWRRQCDIVRGAADILISKCHQKERGPLFRLAESQCHQTIGPITYPTYIMTTGRSRTRWAATLKPFDSGEAGLRTLMSTSPTFSEHPPTLNSCRTKEA